MTNRILSAINNDGLFSFDSSAHLITNSKSININSKITICNINSKEQTIIQSKAN